MRGKKLLDTVRKADCPEVGCAAITRDADKAQFAVAEFRRAERLIDTDALRMLVEAVGADLRELASACAQLIADTTGKITADQVERYYGGRVETTSFAVADAAIAGNTGQALALARHAMATGVSPVVLVAALASKLRILAKVGGARRRGVDPVKDLGLAPFAVTRAKKEIARWDGNRLGAAIRAVAQADAGVKGAVRDPRYAVEKAILAVCFAAAGTKP
jgi:DNA polymerase-3 subunit delta